MLDSNTFGDMSALRKAWDKHEIKMRSVLDAFAPDRLDQVIEYHDTKRNVWRQAFWKLLQHVVNHASYHRGQVTWLHRTAATVSS